MTAIFKDFPLRLIHPSFDSDLTDVLIELEKLRELRLTGDVHPLIFVQLKNVFHILESLGSARIEGNHTTLIDYVESHIEQDNMKSDHLAEIFNLEKAMIFIDENLQAGDKISEYFIRELHALAVKDLQAEGDETPGQYRQKQVQIAQSKHLPPEHLKVRDYMQELVAFINNNDKPKYDLMKIALAHHRFCWIHPFGNGNGRTVRLLTYALLIKYGFNVQTGGRVLNPTAVFCNDRNRYYSMFEVADSGTEEGLEAWCTYVLDGISKELKKVDKLTDKQFLNRKILLPAIQHSLKNGMLSKKGGEILKLAIEKGEFKVGDLEEVMPNTTSNQRTYQVKKLMEKEFIKSVSKNSRIYIPNFSQSDLTRGVIKALSENGFVGNLDD